MWRATCSLLHHHPSPAPLHLLRTLQPHQPARAMSLLSHMISTPCPSTSGSLNRERQAGFSPASSLLSSASPCASPFPAHSCQPVRWQSNKKKGGSNAAGSGRGGNAGPSAAGGAGDRAGVSKSQSASSSKSSSSTSSSSSSDTSAASSNRAGGGIEGDIIFTMRNLGKILTGGRVLFSNINLAFQRGAKIGVLGLNGAGKSSLLKIIAGVDTEFDGEVWKADLLKVGYLQQEPQLDASKTVHENIMEGLKEKTDLLKRFEELSAAMGEPDADLDKLLEEQAAVQSEIELKDCWSLNHTVDIAKQALRVPPDDADVSKLSGGERRRVALCRLLLEQPDVLLLDEPTNHLDASSVAWLEGFLRDYKGTVLAITHDRYFLDNVAGWILEIDRGNAYPYQGNYSLWLEKKQSRLDLEKKTEAKKAKAMAEELQWIRQGVRGRQTKSKARISSYEKMVEEVTAAKAKEKFLSGAIVIPPAPRLGDRVIEAEGLCKSFEGRPLIKDLSFSIPKGAIVGIVGGNGTGKSTLLKMIAGELQPDKGSIALGQTVKLGMVSQSRSELTENQRVIDVVGDGRDHVLLGDVEMPIRQYLASFNLVGELQNKLVRSLSGGERNRVHLARVLKTGANLLMLDEPTNDLDVDTLRSLEEALQDYTGCALIVSHDRYFLDRIATHTMMFKGPGGGAGAGAGAADASSSSLGSVDFFEGNVSEYLDYVAKHGSINPGGF